MSALLGSNTGVGGGLLAHITPLNLTRNEEANTGRLLDKLRWAGESVVVDSGSADATRKICASFSNVRFVVRSFECHAA